MILAGDIGGTHTRLQLSESGRPGGRILARREFSSAAYRDLVPMVREFLSGQDEPPEAACFAVAGPVRDGEARITNLPWLLSEIRLARELNIARVALINDFQGVAYGVDALPPSAIETLQAGRPVAQGPRLVVGAGTGLGGCVTTWCDGGFLAFAAEPGHMDFAPADAFGRGLLDYLGAREERVSQEAVLSGPGLARIYDYLKHSGAAPESAAIRKALQQSDPAAVISEAGLRAEDPLCTRALEHFVRNYGAQVGNLALSVLPLGGVYIAGGIAPKIIAALKDGSFIEAFRRKPPMTAVLSALPVKVVLDAGVGLLGAVYVANRTAGS